MCSYLRAQEPGFTSFPTIIALRIHARHRGEGWIARVGLSYLESTIELISIAPAKNIPLQRVVNRLLSDVQARVPGCRRGWWLTQGTTCLTNRWALVSKPGKITLLLKPTPSAKQLAEAEYDLTEEQIHVIFRDGTKVQMKL